ncbi:MAG: MCE family protein [Polaromonas sp.]|uniref:MlaD family protein n=1 Tax=Polaromonas sp. TaxID=1869339 RepID=UPI001829DB9B|nr:MlaD family protein [Polaromonas sp.]NMM09870.1 MCE family protein [Polaromonas sp.]
MSSPPDPQHPRSAVPVDQAGQDPADPLQRVGATASSPKQVANLELKARLLMLFMLLLVCGSVLYVLYARGAFETTQRLVLMAEDSEGVVVGMDLTFAGFPIGRVRRIELAEDGKARILVDVGTKDAHWLRTSSVFTLVRGIVGSTNIRAYTGILKDPALPDGAVRTVLQGDASAEIPKVISAAKDLIDNLSALTSSGGSVGTSLTNLQTLTGRLNGPGGALTVLLGSEQEAKKLVATLDRTNALLSKLDGLAAKTDTQVFGEKGVMPETRATVVQLNTLLGEARASLKKVDIVLKDAQAVSSNAKDATADLGALRADVDANLRKIESLVNEINRKWPFARDAEIKLP